MVLLQLHAQLYARYTLQVYCTPVRYCACLQLYQLLADCEDDYTLQESIQTQHNIWFGCCEVRDSEPTKGFPTVNQLTGGNCLVCPARVLQFGAASTVVNTSGDTSNRK